MKQLPLSALRAFEAAARTGSFRAAGEELAISPSAVSHAIRKRPPPGEFRTNSRYKPIRTAEAPPPAVSQQGAACLATLPEMPLYARVDGIVRDGTLIVIEVEVLEPALAMDFDPPSAERFAEATMKRLG